jgi:hypothetical protein
MNIVNDLGENIRREHWKSALQNWNPAQPKWAAPDVNWNDYLGFLMAAWAAARRAMGTRKGEQDT